MGIFVWYMYANMMSGRLLNTPKAEMLKFLKPTAKLPPRSGVSVRSNRQMHTIANTIYRLIMKEKNEEKRSWARERASETGKTSTNYYLIRYWKTYTEDGGPKDLANGSCAYDFRQRASLIQMRNCIWHQLLE